MSEQTKAWDAEALLALLRGNLRVEVETKPSYTGGMDGRPLYEDSQKIQIFFGDELISEAYL